MRLIGVFAVIALAVAALVVSSATAAEVGECLKVPKVEGKFQGKFTDKNCQVPATPTQEAEGRANKWEWSPGVSPAHAGFTGRSSAKRPGAAVAIVGAAGNIECQKSFTTGEWTGPKTATEQSTFLGCVCCRSGMPGECHSPGQPEETIVTNTLDVALLGEGESSLEYNGETKEYEPKTVGPGEVWEQLRGPGGELGAVQMEYECGKVVIIRTEGSLAGVVPAGSVNVAVKKFEVGFDEGKGAQGSTSEANILGKGFVPIGKFVLKWAPQMKATGKIEFRP
jgi:hypothetical protein